MSLPNCLILGCGRSGTSMTAGVLSEAGYFMGNRLCPADEGNPKGYFEDEEVNGINEELLGQVVPLRPPGIVGNLFFQSRLNHWQRWLARVPLDTEICCPVYLEKRIKNMVVQEPFCFKDPRFCYTLPMWLPFLKNMVFICVFREPVTTAHSLLKEAQREARLKKMCLKFELEDGFNLWELMYARVLNYYFSNPSDVWGFINYDEFLTGSAFEKLEKLLGRPVNRGFVEAKLKRTTAIGTAPQGCLKIYDQLCKLAGYGEVV